MITYYRLEAEYFIGRTSQDTFWKPLTRWDKFMRVHRQKWKVQKSDCEDIYTGNCRIILRTIDKNNSTYEDIVFSSFENHLNMSYHERARLWIEQYREEIENIEKRLPFIPVGKEKTAKINYIEFAKSRIDLLLDELYNWGVEYYNDY